ncbi:MAG: hypothetical protein HQ488_01360 [Parcubacteria group bacterium]|nr:hypothetical protein [Parcubacteria group bacterium]
MQTIFKKFLAGSIVAMALVGTFVPLTVVNAAAAEMCDCYCTDYGGAKKPVDAKITSDECNTKCTEKKENVAAFACGANQHPSRTPFCFDAEDCAEKGGEWNSGYQPPECTTGFRYCYPNPTTGQKVELQVKIGTYSSSIDFGEYIGVMYRWMVSSAVLLAVIMLMIGGIRYTLGAASDQIAAAKKMMSNALIGLVLLLCTYMILFTVNPDLVSLQVPRLPMIKQISLLNASSCSDLLNRSCTGTDVECKRYKIDFDGPESCGTVGTVTEDPEGNAVPDGTVCNFTNCTGAGADPNREREICVPGDEPTCMGCEQLTSDNNVLVPTADICSAFNALPSYETDKAIHKATYTPNSGPNKGKPIEWEEQVYTKYEQCFLSFDADVGGEFPLRPSCARVVVQCSEINTCADYMTRPVFGGGGQTTLGKMDLGKTSGLNGTDSGLGKILYDKLGDITLGSFCSGKGSLNDICAWERSDADKACYIDYGSMAAIADAIPDVPYSYSCKTSPDTGGWFYTLFD